MRQKVILLNSKIPTKLKTKKKTMFFIRSKQIDL